VSRVARGLSWVAGEAVPAQLRPAFSSSRFLGEVAAQRADGGVVRASREPLHRSSSGPCDAHLSPGQAALLRPHEIVGRMRLPAPASPTLSELFAAHPRDGGWAGFLLAQVDRTKPVLWIQERMAILESGRVHPPGLAVPELIHVETRDARDALWAMEEGLRCAGLSAVIGELWGDPRALDFTATRRLAVAAERNGVPCWLVRLGGAANLSGARMRWRIASAPSLAHPFDARAPGAAWST